MAKPKKKDAPVKDGTSRIYTRMRLLSAGSKRSDGPVIDVCRSSETIQSRTKYVLSTGIEPIDAILGGGFPFGKIIELYGVESSGKTALSLLSMVRAQTRHVYHRSPSGELTQIDDNTDVTIVFIDNEQSVEDNQRIVVNGVRLDCVLLRCDTIDQIFKIIDTSIKELEAVEKETKRKQLLVIVVDTVAGTASREELTSAWDKEDYPRQPKMLRKGFRILTRKLQDRNVCAIFTNQVSFKFSQPKKGGSSRGSAVPVDDDFSSPGGKALRFFAHCRVFLSRAHDIKLVKGQRYPSGFVSHVQTVKSRLVPPSRTIRMALLYDGGISPGLSIAETLCFDKRFAERGPTGIVFKLGANGINSGTATVSDDSSLDDLAEDIAEGEGKVPKATLTLKNLSDWDTVYKNSPELQELWAKFRESLFAVASVVSDSDDLDEDGDDDDEEN